MRARWDVSEAVRYYDNGANVSDEVMESVGANLVTALFHRGDVDTATDVMRKLTPSARLRIDADVNDALMHKLV